MCAQNSDEIIISEELLKQLIETVREKIEGDKAPEEKYEAAVEALRDYIMETLFPLSTPIHNTVGGRGMSRLQVPAQKNYQKERTILEFAMKQITEDKIYRDSAFRLVSESIKKADPEEFLILIIDFLAKGNTIPNTLIAKLLNSAPDGIKASPQYSKNIVISTEQMDTLIHNIVIFLNKNRNKIRSMEQDQNSLNSTQVSQPQEEGEKESEGNDAISNVERKRQVERNKYTQESPYYNNK